VLHADVGRALKQGRLGARPFTLLFLDPPYRISKSEVRALIEALAAAGLLAPGAVVAWEYAAGSEPDWPPAFESLSPRRYGSIEVDIAVFGTDGEDG
jgi:16S rRNA (guanine966-N2)-methyltransferase